MNRFFSREFLLDNKEKLIRSVIIILIAIAAVFVFFVQPKQEKGSVALEDSSSALVSEEDDPSTDPAVVICDVSGAVNSPQVVELEEGARIEDAIEAAGGLTDKADISGINRAAVVNDGDKILIPEKGEQGSQNGAETAGNVSTGQDTSVTGNTGTGTIQQTAGKININNADSTQLQTISGIGPVTAQKIIDYRTDNGRFSKIEDIKNVSGIGDKTFEKMKDQITV